VPLSGEAFSSRWADMEHSVDDLLYIVRTLMPYSEPGKLSKQEYLDIVTYILKVNGYPGGNIDLPLDAKTLGSIKLKR
jgi:S-disulfanyl-L-cysteine oxidoreductase SoxD